MGKDRAAEVVILAAATFEFAMVGWFQPPPAQPQTRDIEAVFSPEPMAVARALYGPLNEMGLWTVRISSPVATQIDSGLVYMAATRLGLISKGHALVVLRSRRGDRWQSRTVKALALLNGACALVTGAYAARETGSRKLVKIASGCGIGAGVFAFAGPKLEASIPPLDEGEILDGTLALMPGQVVTRVVFARKQPNVKPVTIQIPQ